MKPLLGRHLLIKRMRTPKKYLKQSFLLLLTCIKWTLVIKFHHLTCQTPDMWKIATHKFFDLYSTELVSLIWFLQLSCNLHLWYYDQLVHCNKEINILIVTGSILNLSTVYLNCIWHLIGRYLSKPVLGGHPVSSGHYSIPRGCPLNTGFTVIIIYILY